MVEIRSAHALKLFLVFTVARAWGPFFTQDFTQETLLGKAEEEERDRSKADVPDSILPMSAYANVVGGKLKLKGKPLDVRVGGIKKKMNKKKKDAQQQQLRLLTGHEGDEEQGGARDNFDEQANKHSPLGVEEEEKGEGGGEDEEGRAGAPCEDRRTAAEKRYHEHKARLEAQRSSKVACKSHRQRVEEFNQYLANLSEHYDIPKVGPG